METLFDYYSSNTSSRQDRLLLNKYNKVLILGVGGIGSWVAIQLALSGKVNKIVLVDPDTVEKTNLNRTLFRIADIGSYKVDALSYLILERRPEQALDLYKGKFPNILKSDDFFDAYDMDVCIDCRDEIYDDYKFLADHCKIWKLGYDGFSLTIDGNPRNTVVMGETDNRGYETVPSFICPAELIANLVVTNILKGPNLVEDDNAKNHIDEKGLFNTVMTFDSGNLLDTIYTNTNNVNQ